jgi:hypothetical protein
MQRKANLILLFIAITFLFVTPAFAQNGDTGNTTLGIAEQIIAVAGIVTAVLQGLKKLLPNIQGTVAILFSVVLSIAGAYAVAPADQVLTLAFLFQVILTVLGSNGIYGLLQAKTTASTTQ